MLLVEFQSLTRALLSSRKVLQVIISQCIPKPNIRETHGVKGKQFAGQVHYFLPLLVTGGQLRKGTVRTDVLGVGDQRLLKRMASSVQIVGLDLCTAEFEPRLRVLG